jgi:hypothetical protein
MEDYNLTDYLDPISKVWPGVRPTHIAVSSQKTTAIKKISYQKKKYLTYNNKKNKA